MTVLVDANLLLYAYDADSPRHAICTDARARSPLVMDAHLAALALAHGATVATTDRDFRRFDGIRFTNPLDSGQSR